MGNVIPINARRLEAEARYRILQATAERFGRCGVMEDLCDQIRYACERLAMIAPPRYQAECLHALKYVADDMPLDYASMRCVLICLNVLDARYIAALGLD